MSNVEEASYFLAHHGVTGMKWHSHRAAAPKPKVVKKKKKVLTAVQVDIAKLKAAPGYRKAVARMSAEKASESKAKASVAAGVAKLPAADKAQLMTFLQEHGVHAP